MPPSNGHTAILTVEDHFSMMAHFSSHLYSGGSSAHLTGPQSAYHWVSPPVQWPVRTQEPGGGDGSTMFGLQTSVVLVPAAPVGGIHLQHLDQLFQRTFPSSAPAGSSCHSSLLWRRKSLVCLSRPSFVIAIGPGTRNFSPPLSQSLFLDCQQPTNQGAHPPSQPRCDC